LDGEPQTRAIASGITSDVFQGAVGNGGQIVLNGGRLDLLNGGEISSVSAGNGNAGDIRVNGGDRLLIRGARADDGIPSRITNRLLAGPKGKSPPRPMILRAGIFRSKREPFAYSATAISALMWPLVDRKGILKARSHFHNDLPLI
ncbi:MAG: hypothetical protein F6K65_38275, partial [Moorea sp. SIO3C2]|nr:hypothetical protein [Moorena sp. SIO3C2]